jgi:hypothetical protein
MMRAFALLLVTACAVHAPALAPDDPANARAPIGQLARAPTSLTPGTVGYDEARSHPTEPSTPAEPGKPAEPGTPAEPGKPAEPEHHHHH